MKIVVNLFLVLISLSFVSASPSLEISDQNPQPYETVLGILKEFNGILSEDDLKFYEGRREVSFEKDLFKFNESYFFYFRFGREGNFTFKMEDLTFKSEGILQEINFEKKFSVEIIPLENGTKILSIDPGYIFEEKSSEILFTNRGSLPLKFEFLKEKIELEPTENKKILATSKEEFEILTVKSYKEFNIPVKFSLDFETEDKINNTLEIPQSLKASYEDIEVNTQPNKEFTRQITLFNFGEFNLTKISVDKKLKFLEIELPKSLNPSQEGVLTLTGQAEEGIYKDNLTVSYEEDSIKRTLIIPVEIFVFSENSSVEEVSQIKRCDDLGGSFCNKVETCKGRLSVEIPSCCIGYCDSGSGEETGTKESSLIGIVIVIIVGIGGYFVWKKYKSIKPSTGEYNLGENKKEPIITKKNRKVNKKEITFSLVFL